MLRSVVDIFSATQEPGSGWVCAASHRFINSISSLVYGRISPCNAAHSTAAQSINLKAKVTEVNVFRIPHRTDRSRVRGSPELG